MLKKILLHIVLLLGLTGLVLSSGLQYTHDQDHHGCATTSEHREQAGEHCALCWFVSHQVLNDFYFAPLLPEARLSLVFPAAIAPLLVRFPEQVHSLKSNKDPPYTL